MIALSSVVFPEPFGPVIATRSGPRISSERSWTSTLSPWPTETLSSLSTRRSATRPDGGKLTLTNFNFTNWQNGHVEEQIHLPDAEALYQLMQERFGLGVDDAKHGFSLAELTAVMAGFDTHPQAGK